MGLSKSTPINDNDILAAILRVDGDGSGIDADYLNGSHADDLVPSIDPITKHWHIQGIDTGIVAEGIGTNGVTPHIDPITKYWHIGETDTGILAQGTNGTNGTNGVTPHIDSGTKHWFIGATDTGIVAEGVNGSSAEKATQAEAEAGVEDSKFMTALKTKQEINALIPLASTADAQTGTNDTKYLTPLKAAQEIEALGAYGNRKYIKIWTDCIVSTQGVFDGTGFATFATGATLTGGLSEANHPGVLGFGSPSSGAGCNIRTCTNNNNFVVLGNERIEFIFKTYSSQTNRLVMAGFTDVVTSTTPTNAIYFYSLNGALSARTIKAGVTTDVPLFTTSNSTWYRLEAIVNSSATSITFNIYADNSNTPLATVTSTTNIPTVPMDIAFQPYAVTNLSGVTLAYLDYMSYEIKSIGR